VIDLFQTGPLVRSQPASRASTPGDRYYVLWARCCDAGWGGLSGALGVAA